MRRKLSLLSIKIITRRKLKGLVTTTKITSHGKVSLAKSWDKLLFALLPTYS